MKTIQTILWQVCHIVSICVIFSACSEQPSILNTEQSSALNSSENEFIFPTQQNLGGPRGVMEALLIGQLVKEDNSLRIQAREGGTRYIVVWPPDYTFRTTRGQIEVLDETGKMRVKVGEEVFVSGGETKTVMGIQAIREDLQQDLSSRNDGPYWIVGAEVHSIANVPDQFHMWLD